MRKIDPIGERVLIRHDEFKGVTKSGIILPDTAKIPVLTGRILAVGEAVDKVRFPISIYDKIIYDPRQRIPVDLDQDNKLFLINIEDVLAVVRTTDEVEMVEVDEKIVKE